MGLKTTWNSYFFLWVYCLELQSPVVLTISFMKILFKKKHSNEWNICEQWTAQDRAGVSKGYGFVTFETEEEARRLQVAKYELDFFVPFYMFSSFCFSNIFPFYFSRVVVSRLRRTILCWRSGSSISRRPLKSRCALISNFSRNMKRIRKRNMKHCQRHNGPEGWVHITTSDTNLDQISISET